MELVKILELQSLTKLVVDSPQSTITPERSLLIVAKTALVPAPRNAPRAQKIFDFYLFFKIMQK